MLEGSWRGGEEDVLQNIFIFGVSEMPFPTFSRI